MDPVTHIASGLAAGQALRSRFPAGRWFLPFCGLAAWLPDIDNPVGMFGAEAYMRYHRGITHSLLGGAVLALLLTGAARLAKKDLPFGKTLALAYGLILLHVFLDVITTYGTQVLMPFSDVRVGLPAVFIIDPPMTLTLCALVILSFVFPGSRKALGAAGLALCLLWPAAGFTVGRVVEAQVQRRLDATGEADLTAHVQPDALAPFFWKVIIEDRDGYVLTGLDLLDPKRIIPERRFKKADRAELSALGRFDPVFAAYAWFTDFPVRFESQNGSGTAVTFADIRFMSVNPLVARVRGESTPFVLTAELDAAGRLVAGAFRQFGATLPAPGSM